MISALRTSLSGLNAASESMSARADNIVNARTSARVDEVSLTPAATAAAEDVFRPYRVVNQSTRGGGVETEVEPVEPSHAVVDDPDDSNADAEGRVALPNVSLEEEVVGMRRDRTYWMANLAAMRTADEMAGALLDEEA
jgi:flagellar basal-body rod protein FlgC